VDDFLLDFRTNTTGPMAKLTDVLTKADGVTVPVILCTLKSAKDHLVVTKLIGKKSFPNDGTATTEATLMEKLNAITEVLVETLGQDMTSNVFVTQNKKCPLHLLQLLHLLPSPNVIVNVADQVLLGGLLTGGKVSGVEFRVLAFVPFKLLLLLQEENMYFLPVVHILVIVLSKAGPHRRFVLVTWCFSD